MNKIQTGIYLQRITINKLELLKKATGKSKGQLIDEAIRQYKVK